MYSVEIHTPITMNEHFSVMCYLLVRSLAQNAEFPGEWKVVFTVSLDSDLTLDSPQFSWVKDYPVEFHKVDSVLWERMHYDGTGLQSITTEKTADVVLYLDADVIVIGSLASITAEMVGTDAIFAWPAWFSGQTPFDELFEAAGIKTTKKYEIKLTDDGADFEDPNWPPYFNFGFVGMSQSFAHKLGRTFPVDLAFVMKNFENYFSSQVALALTIERNKYNYRAVDECYNVGSDHPVALAHYEKSLGRKMLPSKIANDDPRVMHYCFPTPSLRKKRDMANWDSLGLFLKRDGLEGSEKVIQRSLLDLDLFNEKDPYTRAQASFRATRNKKPDNTNTPENMSDLRYDSTTTNNENN